MFDWTAFLDVAGGVAALLVGLAVFIAGLALARTLRRLDRTLDGLDEQVAALGKPVSETLAEEVIALPMHAYLDAPTQDRIIGAVKRALA